MCNSGGKKSKAKGGGNKRQSAVNAAVDSGAIECDIYLKMNENDAADKPVTDDKILSAHFLFVQLRIFDALFSSTNLFSRFTLNNR